MSSNEVTRIISRSINPGREKDYDDWLRRYLEFERRARGYLGTTVIVPGGSSSNIRYIIHRFSDKDAMDEWEKSEQALKLLEEVNNYSKRHYETASGMETWFTLPDHKTVIAPPKWKMAIVVFIAAYATSALSRSSLPLFIGSQPLLVESILYTGILVVSLTFITMPMLSRLLRHWLYPESANHLGR